MGKDENAVVSEKLKVYIENLRVIDASIMPSNFGQYKYPLLYCEKGADMILND